MKSSDSFLITHWWMSSFMSLGYQLTELPNPSKDFISGASLDDCSTTLTGLQEVPKVPSVHREDYSLVKSLLYTIIVMVSCISKFVKSLSCSSLPVPTHSCQPPTSSFLSQSLSNQWSLYRMPGVSQWMSQSKPCTNNSLLLSFVTHQWCVFYTNDSVRLGKDNLFMQVYVNVILEKKVCVPCKSASSRNTIIFQSTVQLDS